MKVAFYGDSIVTGWRGISSAERRWSSIVSAALGWQELNIAVDGLGFVRWRGPDRTHSGEVLGVLTDVLDSDADACVVALGGNDSVVVADLHDGVRTAIERDLAMLVDRFGRHRVAVLDLYSPFADEKPPGWRAVRALLESAVHEHGLHLVPGLTDAVRQDPGLLCADGVHPNDAGHAALASAVTPHLRSVFARG
ncbi:MAG: SGNH/GDSL hydrolase family protein [Blastococcus sp.]